MSPSYRPGLPPTLYRFAFLSRRLPGLIVLGVGLLCLPLLVLAHTPDPEYGRDGDATEYVYAKTRVDLPPDQSSISTWPYNFEVMCYAEAVPNGTVRWTGEIIGYVVSLEDPLSRLIDEEYIVVNINHWDYRFGFAGRDLDLSNWGPDNLSEVRSHAASELRKKKLWADHDHAHLVRVNH